MLTADYQVFLPLNLVRLSLSTLWPALALSVALSVLFVGNLLKVFRERCPVLSRWSRSDDVLIAEPVYLWGILAAWNLLLMFDVLGPPPTPQFYCAFALSQFLGLALIMGVIGLQSVFYRREESRVAPALVGPLLAVGAVAIDYIMGFAVVVLIERGG